MSVKRNEYPLVAAQNMHYQWIREYKTQQVSGVSIIASLKAELDFGLLKKCIQMEYQRYGCMRLRFTKPDKDGNIKQYLVKQDTRDIPLKDLSGMTMKEADDLMQQWAYETLDGDNRSMCDIYMMKLPEGYNGFFIHMDHRLIDSCGLVVLVEDLMALYTHYRFGSDYPQPLADFETVLQNDLAKASNEKRFAKDKKFWDDQLDALGEPLYSDIQGPSVLEEARKKHKNKKLRAADIEREKLFVAVKDYVLEPEPTKGLIDFCMNHQISMTNLLLLSIRTYLSKVNNGQEDITIENFISRRSTHDEWTSGGSRTIMFPCRTVLPADMDFLSAAYEIQNVQNRIYMHSNYDPALIREEMKRRYKTPDDTTYESCYLTYQPMPVKPQNSFISNIPMHNKWFANGAATKKMYLTVSHTENGGMNFSYHYQTVKLNEKDMELMYYYMMRILFMGISNPDLKLGEIMDMV
ncbi:MAG: chromosome condensation protein [Eubacterium sp.]|nr:chromosome condensation protein [Eubacterium sp.]